LIILRLLAITFELETLENQSNPPKTRILALLLMKTRFKNWLLALSTRVWWRDPNVHKPAPIMMPSTKKSKTFQFF